MREGAGRTLAQTMSLLIGATLIAVGVLGFIFGGSDFAAGSDVQGDEFIVFEVNGWHNVVHLATGGLLVLMAGTAASAVTGLMAFGLAYVAVTVWGFVDGNDVVSLIPVNTADNWLHLALAVGALAVVLFAGGLLASARRREPR
ncbi:MAG: DUF4383 domain-containing protein [Actinomycetota bacterium]|nr:DUF4383 domain-containing protein [Actinomycetota bacterium]